MRIRGKVVRGIGVGSQLGYPTANLASVGLNYPDSGVYAARVTWRDEAYFAAAIIGARKENSKPLVEVHLLDFKGDLSGQELVVELIQKVSEIKRFNNRRELVSKIADDVEKVRMVCSRGLLKPLER